MSDLDRLQTALINADAAGDTAAATAFANEIRRMQPTVDKFTATAQSDSNTDNLLASIGGAMKAPYLGVKQMLGMTTPDEIAEYKQSMGGLWSTPMGKVGTVAGGVASAAPLAMIPGANTAVGAALGGAAFGGVQPVGDGESRLSNAGFGAAGGVGGKYAGEALGSMVSGAMSNRAVGLATQKAQNAVRDATVKEAQQAGYVIPPTQVNPQSPGAINRVLEGVSGKIQTAQAAAIKNQEVTDNLAKQALGLPKDVPLTPGTLRAVREVAGQAYKQLKSFGPIRADDEYAAALTNVAGEYESLAANFGSQKIPALDNLLADLRKPAFNSGDAVELVKRLRHDGFKNVASQDPEKVALGRVQIGAQNAVEDLIDRNLSASGNDGFLDVFRRAREMIAKSYTVEKALEESSGKVVAGKIGKELAKGRPLTGELATIGKTAQAFPKALQNVNSSMPGLSPLDAMAGAGLGVASGNPLAALTPLARPIIRSGLLSSGYQRAMVNPPSYEMGLLGRNAPGLANNDATLALLRSLGMSLPADQ